MPGGEQSSSPFLIFWYTIPRMTSHDVPFISQYEGITDPAWQWRGCGIVGLKMVLDYWHARHPGNKTASLEELFRAGLDVGAYREGIGWTHRGLVDIAARYGYRGFNADYAPKSPTPRPPDAVWAALLGKLARGPVLASVHARLDPERGGGHIVVVTGFSDSPRSLGEAGGLVSLCDPEEMDERDGRKVLTKERFFRAFKLRYIVIEPSGLRARPPGEAGR